MIRFLVVKNSGKRTPSYLKEKDKRNPLFIKDKGKAQRLSKLDAEDICERLNELVAVQVLNHSYTIEGVEV